MRQKIYFILLLFFVSCGINDSWEVDGGGYIKYKINSAKERTIELDRYDAEIPWIKNGHSYFIFQAKGGKPHYDTLTVMVNRPVLDDNKIVENYSFFTTENSPRGRILNEKSNVHFDQKDDSTWTADLDLYAVDCRSGTCLDTLPPLHITGRFRYWIPEEWR